MDAGRIPRVGPLSRKSGLTGQRRYSLAPSSACHERNSFPRSHLRRPAQNPQRSQHQLRAYPIPVLADPKKIIRALDHSELSKASLAQMPSTPPQALSSQSTFPTPSALWTNPGRYCQKLCIGHGRILVGTAAKGVRQSTRRNRPVHHPSEAGTISFAFPAAHHTSTASEFSLVLSTRSDSFKLRL
jgi:hypothetical protein